MEAIGGHGVPGAPESYWLASSPGTGYPPLEGEVETDVVIVGGGFAGIISALFLKEAGFKVAVIEARRILTGVTGNTTAKITSLHRLVYANLVKSLGQEKARQYADANQAAIEKLAALVEARKIPCDFSRLPFYVYAADRKDVPRLEQEVKAAQSVGLEASFVDEVALPFATAGAIRLDNQAQFHPLKFLREIARSLPGEGSHIFENSRVIRMDHGPVCRASTDKGRVKARYAVVATNFPVLDREGFFYARLQPARSYAIAGMTDRAFPRAMFIDADESGNAWRAQPEGDGNLIIVSGAGHAPGRVADTRARYRKLAGALKEAYADAAIKYSWSTQDNVSYDLAPYIGRYSPLHDNIFVATGFGKWGMTTSTVAGLIIADMVQKRHNPWLEVYSPLRFVPDTAAAGTLIGKNARVIETFIKERLTRSPQEPEPGPDEGLVLESGGKRLAVYKDSQGALFRVSPYCTHMQCVVHWNNAERSWDCPCHGSRFDHTGRVIHSPAVKDLDREE